MDEAVRSQELLDSVDISQLRPDGKLNTSVPVMKVDDEGEPPPITQYINIHRVPEALGKGLVDCGSPATQTLIGGDLIPHHVVHNGMVVDMMVPSSGAVTSEFSQHHYLPDSYEEDVLLHHECLTDEDRRLAAALVAVQIVQQQKQHQHEAANVIVGPGGLTGLKEHHHMTTMSPVPPVTVPTYIQDDQHILDQGDRMLKLYQPDQLPPLKKSIPNNSSSPTLRSRYLRVEMSGVPGSAVNQDMENRTGQNHRRRPAITSDPLTPDELKEEYDIKSEGVEDEESDEIPQDDSDSDYDIESDLRTSRKSLPHKKRIPRKLKNPKKSSSPSRSIHSKCYKCNKCGDQFASQSTYSAHRATHVSSNKKTFSCELCGKGFAHQLKFFEHLKSHYEPITSADIAEAIGNKPNNVKDKAIPEEMSVKVESHKVPEQTVTLGAIPPPLVCNQCGKTFRRQKAFDTHVSLAHPKQEEIEFSDPEDLMEGIRDVVNVGGTDTGDEADMDCLSPSTMVSSVKNNVKDWYRDEDLHEAEVDLQEMEDQHQQLPAVQQAVADNTCELCGAGFDSKAEVNQHLQEEHLEIRIDLEKIPPTFGSDNSESPSKRKSPAKRSTRRGLHQTCPDCGRTFNHRNSLVYHLRSHSGERPYQCEVCGKSFFAASALKVHMRLHSGDKPYKCEYCGSHFRQWGDLKYHCISIHSEEKNYQCEYCGKDFARKYSLVVHRRIHTGEKNYKCEFCEKSFRASSYLQNHRRIHTGEKPHPCEICGKPFRVRSDMKRHLNTHTRDRHRTGSGDSLLHPTKVETSDSDILPPSSHTMPVDHQPAPGLSAVTEITVQSDGTGPESILPDESLGDNGTVAVLPSRHHHLAETAQQSGVGDEVLQYTRDPLDSVRDTSNTLYVWPIYMS